MRAERFALVRNMLLAIPTNAEGTDDRSPSLVNAHSWLAPGAGAVLLFVGASRVQGPAPHHAPIGLKDASAMYRTCHDRQDVCIKVVMKPGATTFHHTEPPVHGSSDHTYGQIISTTQDCQG